MASDSGVKAAGDVDIEMVLLIKPDGTEVDIRTYVGELNIYEDMFRGGMYGNVLMIDAGNLAQNLPIIGEESIRIKFKTPSLDQEVFRQFKVYSVTDKMMLRDTNTQSYILHFVSPEVFLDMLAPVYGTRRGKSIEHILALFDENLKTSRTGVGGDSEIIQKGATENDIVFTSPGWSPIKCINWICSKSVPMFTPTPSLLFYESNKNFYLANVGTLIKDGKWADYYYMASNVSADRNGSISDDENVDRPFMRDMDEAFSKVEDFDVVESFNAFKNVQRGYYANRLITLDVATKEYQVWDYDHVSAYDKYPHLENVGGLTENIAPFTQAAVRSPASFIQFMPKHTQLYTDVKTNWDTSIQDIMMPRVSLLTELTNFKVVLTVPGRTDAEVGKIIYFHYPDSSPRDETDKSKLKEDTYYSGYYLITAIRHKITLQKHMMIMEAVKDSYRRGNT